MAAIAVTYKFLNGRTNSGPELTQNFLDLINGLTDGTKDITIGILTASNFSGSSSGTNTGDVSLATFGSSPNSNGASLSGQALTLQPASVSQPGGVNITTQSFAGNKTLLGTFAIQDGHISITLGADNGANTLTDSTQKTSRVANFHYTNAQAPMALIVGNAKITTNVVSIGGGSSSLNTATDIEFYTAANTITTSGTKQGSIVGVAWAIATSSGTIGFYGVTPAARSSAYTVSNRTTDRAYDANATSLDEIADVLGTVILDLQTVGLFN